MLCRTLGLLASFGTAFAETLTTHSAINKAGRQRMLSQRMAKAYCQTGLVLPMGAGSGRWPA